MGLKNISSAKDFISLDNVAYFPPYGDDDCVFCAELPVTSSEFANAGMLDIRAAATLVIDTESDRPDKLTIKYEGKTYAIYRRYYRPDGLTELHLQEKAGLS